jgi:predicted amidophosphoribosyltransferase
MAPDPVVASAGGVPVVAGAAYAGSVQQALLALKDGRTSTASVLAPLLAAAITAADTESEVELAPVPSTRSAMRRRGFDPVLLVLARAGARPTRVLRTARAHRVQKGLGRAERQRNLHGVHRARGPLNGRRFLLVDDVVTTGATISEAARAIRDAGGEVVGAVAIAATPRLGRPAEVHTSSSGKRG